jgi:hypothetical protein
MRLSVSERGGSRPCPSGAVPDCCAARELAPARACGRISFLSPSAMRERSAPIGGSQPRATASPQPPQHRDIPPAGNANMQMPRRAIAVQLRYRDVLPRLPWEPGIR